MKTIKAKVHSLTNNSHLYITTDEDIKEGDWYYSDIEPKGVFKATKEGKATNRRKIIATTDSKLLEPNHKEWTKMKRLEKWLPQIPQSFIEEYCKAGGIDEVLVEYEERFIENSLKNYKRMLDEVIEVVPKLNPDNEITIHLIKDSWSREEVKALLKPLYLKAYHEGHEVNCATAIAESYFDKWIEENL